MRHNAEQTKKLANLLIISAIFVTCLLGAITTIYNLAVQQAVGTHAVLFIIATLYLLCAYHLLHREYTLQANWMLVLYCSLAAVVSMSILGVSTPVGIAGIGLAILLTSNLINSKLTLYVSAASILAIITINTTGGLAISAHTNTAPFVQLPYYELAPYLVLISMFSLIVWACVNLTEVSVLRAKKAEKTVRAQKASLQKELTIQSSLLRQKQLQNTEQLYRFALLGQSAAALLHEMSSRLSVINYDLDDLKLQVKNSEAIKNTEESILHINEMVKQARRQFNSYDNHVKLSVGKLLDKAIRDATLKNKNKMISIFSHTTKPHGASLYGDPLAFTQIVSVLISNACDACVSSASPEINIETTWANTNLLISVTDSGPGVPDNIKKKLFNPLTSLKQNGLGVGLYIAHHLVQTCFKGSIKLDETSQRTRFIVEIPLQSA